MRQLSGTDSLFLRLERGNQYMHVAGLGIYDPSTAPGWPGPLQGRAALFRGAARLPRRSFVAGWSRCPSGSTVRTGSKIRTSTSNFTCGTSRCRTLATGVSSASRSRASIRVRSIAASRCGRPTSSRASTTFRACLPGSFALYLKIHHCAVDGEAGTELIRAIHSTLAEDFSEPAARVRRYKDRMPTAPELYLRAVGARSRPRARSRAALGRNRRARGGRGRGGAGRAAIPARYSTRRRPWPDRGGAAQTASNAFRRQGIRASRRRSRGPAARRLQDDPRRRFPRRRSTTCS